VAQRVGRGIALLFHDRGTRRRWVVSSTPRPHFTPGKDPVPIVQEAGWAPGPVWTGGKSLSHRDSIPDRPARSSVAIPTELPGKHDVKQPQKKTAILDTEHILRKVPMQKCKTFNMGNKIIYCIDRISATLWKIIFLAQQPQWARASSFTRFLDHTQRHTTVGRTSLHEWSARRSTLYLTTHNTHNRQTSMPPVGSEHTISGGERP